MLKDIPWLKELEGEDLLEYDDGKPCECAHCRCTRKLVTHIQADYAAFEVIAESVATNAGAKAVAQRARERLRSGDTCSPGPQ